MNELFDEKTYKKLVKMFYLRLDYRPGPNMEEKILRALRRRKRRMLFFKVSIVVLLALIAIWLGPSRTRDILSSVLGDITEGKRNEQVKEQQDIVFETLKYTSVANDGHWSENW
ncbi:hypothetical protein [Fervidobacterium thailandense]|uniref:Uncharacterized protein n=1 Tax=Fervidobacterium thailandense TaxID=1008305 RepID=A0A1E3G209_9BACT|nr:hypothetical protein [Fervidobacterium thailandense]ODN29863.1 hypothetical protein A4H02_08330 [Fervidobacterium thailandense]